MAGSGTEDDPWTLTTAPGTSAYTMYRDEAADPPALVCRVGATTLRYHLRAIEDLTAYLRERGEWVELGAADEQKPAKAGSVEAWGRAEDNPWADGTACARATGADSGCICLRCWRNLAWSNSSIRRATTGSARSDQTSGL